MNPRTRSVSSAGNQKAGPKRPFPEAKLQLEMAMKLVIREEAAIFNDHLGKEVYIAGEGIHILATLSKIGKDFIKLIDVKMGRPVMLTWVVWKVLSNVFKKAVQIHSE